MSAIEIMVEKAREERLGRLAKETITVLNSISALVTLMCAVFAAINYLGLAQGAGTGIFNRITGGNCTELVSATSYSMANCTVLTPEVNATQFIMGNQQDDVCNPCTITSNLYIIYVAITIFVAMFGFLNLAVQFGAIRDAMRGIAERCNRWLDKRNLTKLKNLSKEEQTSVVDALEAYSNLAASRDSEV